MRVLCLAGATATVFLAGCGGPRLPPDPHPSTQFVSLVEDENRPVLDTSVSECVDGVDPSNQQPIKVCKICLIRAGVVKTSSGRVDIAALRYTGSLQFRLAVSDDQPHVLPAKGAMGVWAMDTESLALDKTSSWSTQSDLTRDVGFQPPTGLASMERTWRGHYIMPEHVRQRINTDPALVSRFVARAGGCSTPAAG